MHPKTLLTALLAIALLIPASAGAYTPRHGKPCRHGYSKRFRVLKRHGHRHKVRICVKRKRVAAQAPTPALATKTKLHAHLDPSFTRDPLDPFKVTYAYSASATQEPIATASASVARASAIEAAPLPSGVLSLYSDGQLECAVNVGSGVEGSECPVHYKALGEHRVTTIYTSGEQSATETEVEMIEPLPTETRLSVRYLPLSEPVEVGSSSGLFHIGDLMIQMASLPDALTPHLGCGEGTVEHLTPAGCYDIEAPAEHVYARSNNPCSVGIEGILISAASERAAIDGFEFSPTEVEDGSDHLRASTDPSSGYLGSEATSLVQFLPGALC